MLKNKLLSAMGGAPANYIEDVFSTWLYTGNGSTQTITNGIDLAGKGGLVWLKARSVPQGHTMTDTARGSNFVLQPQSTAAQVNTGSIYVSAFNSNGFSIGDGSNSTDQTFASWTFREQAKFFDVVTWVGNGTNQTVNHSLGSLPGCIIYKRTDSTSDWFVSTRNSAGNYEFLKLNTTAASVAAVNPASLDVTATSFDPLRLWGNVNGASYVAYLFAHNAGGFGLTGTDNVISCGSFTATAGGGASVTLGYEPQWIIVKRTNAANSWLMEDVMRGMPVGSVANGLFANLSNAEGTTNTPYQPTATGFVVPDGNLTSGDTFIYIAIRRGPMKTPTTGTSVFAPVTYAGGTDPNTLTSGFPVDYVWSKDRNGTYDFSNIQYNRVNGPGAAYTRTSTSAQTGGALQWKFDSNTGLVCISIDPSVNGSGYNYISHFLGRAPQFFDLVSYAGTGSVQTLSHNLTVPCEMMLIKRYDGGSENWAVYHSALGSGVALVLNNSDASFSASTHWNNTAPTSTTFTVGTASPVNASGGRNIAHLFATCPGVSKVGSFTGTGATQVINCGFTGGARFVLIKATSTTGDWYLWDSARGIVAGNDPYLRLNSTAAEVTNTDWVDTAATGFELSNAGGNLANSNGVSYIFLAIA